MGLRHAPHLAPRRHRWALPNDPAVIDRRDDPVWAVLKLDILGGRGHRADELLIYQS